MTNDKQRDGLVELLQEASTEAGKYFRETTKKVLAEKGRFSSKEDIDRRNIYEVEADYLLANGVIVPPCKVGDKVYILEDGKVINYFVLEISKHYNGTMYFESVPQAVNGCTQWFHVGNRFADKNIGKTVFLTKEEAENALGGVQG